MAIPLDQKLYDKTKREVWAMYKKNSAYRSGMLVKLYKQRGGKFADEGERKLERWFQEKWTDVSTDKLKGHYPVYRPTIRVTKDTPKTLSEISKSKLKQQTKLKQKIQGEKNLPKF